MFNFIFFCKFFVWHGFQIFYYKRIVSPEFGPGGSLLLADQLVNSGFKTPINDSSAVVLGFKVSDGENHVNKFKQLIKTFKEHKDYELIFEYDLDHAAFATFRDKFGVRWMLRLIKLED